MRPTVTAWVSRMGEVVEQAVEVVFEGARDSLDRAQQGAHGRAIPTGKEGSAMIAMGALPKVLEVDAVSAGLAGLQVGLQHRLQLSETFNPRPRRDPEAERRRNGRRNPASKSMAALASWTPGLLFHRQIRRRLRTGPF